MCYISALAAQASTTITPFIVFDVLLFNVVAWGILGIFAVHNNNNCLYITVKYNFIKYNSML
jgi:hypothetical protein